MPSTRRASIRRGLRARDVSFKTLIVTQAPGTVVTNVASDYTITVFPETWQIQRPMFDTDAIERDSSCEVT